MNSYDNYYPRPLLKRNSFFSLNGLWELNGQNINVPFPPEAKLSGYDDDLGNLVYRKRFTLPENFYKESDRVILHFGAIDQLADVFLNDTFITHNEGGYLPFSVDISRYLEDDNLLEVRVTDELDYFYPYGKQSKKPAGMWYTPVSGIWKSVWIEALPQNGIENLNIKTDMNSLHLQILSNAQKFKVEFENYCEVFDSNIIDIAIPEPHLWSLQDPYLYKLKITTDDDQIESYFGLRKIETRIINGHERLFMNNRPLFIKGLLDQGYFEKGIYTPENVKEYERDIVGIKELGFNTLRKHIKIEDEAFYYYCDKHGILVIQDMVNSGKYSFFKDTILPTIGFLKLRRKAKDKKRLEFFLDQSRRTIGLLKSHPSLIGYTIYNEGWGQQEASACYEILKKEDPDRLFDATSGWFFDDKSDFDSYHIYFRNKVLKGKQRLLLLSECGGFTRNIEEHSDSKKTSYGYGKTDSEEELTERIIDMHRKMVIPSIENGLVGYIMTQISDVEGEINGMFTYDRSVCKVNKKKILAANNELTRIYDGVCGSAE
ncbi:MAG: glycoside hydrolase family 2 [Erysipelotrichaceae bacterium]|nr:glycoside hydrolase family 2 [Erysipelotrichaceae bacterium]